jgi:hypothetical protein
MFFAVTLFAVDGRSSTNGWRFFSASGNIGPGDGGGQMRLLIYLSAPGSCLIDDISLVAGTNAGVGYNYVANGDFESPLAPGLTNSWKIGANCYGNTVIVNDPVYSGGGAFEVVGTNSAGAANPPTFDKAIFQFLSPAPMTNTINTLSFRYLPTGPGSNLFLRIRNSSNLTTGNNGIPLIVSNATPVILAPPQNQTVTVGGNAGFSVTADGLPPLGYQWRFNGANLEGANQPLLTLTNTTHSMAGLYSVVVSNFHGAVTSTVAQLQFRFLTLKVYAGITIDGEIGQSYRVEYVSALNSTPDWQVLTNITLTNTPYFLIDRESPQQSQRFYRAIPLQ